MGGAGRRTREPGRSQGVIYLEQLRDSRWLRLGVQVGVGLVVIGLIVAGAWAWHRSQESRGMQALANATALAQQVDRPDGSPEARDRAVKALETVIADYPRLSAIPQAAYELGNLKYTSGQYGAARSAYELALAKGASGAIRTLAGLGIGYSFEAEKNYAAAAQAQAAAAKGLGPRDFLFEETLVAEGRAQELSGKPALAVETYERLLKEAPGTHLADELRNRIASLKGRPSQ